jgi:ABC-type antimicrobial peptide transport system permease subunit
LLAAVGLYGVMAYITIRRRNEIGIRMALGADRPRVITLVMKEAALMLVIGVLIGIAGAVALTRAGESLLFGLSAQDPASYTAAIVLLGAITVLGSFVPALRASRVDPMVALRCE